MRGAAYILIGVMLALVQGSLYRFFAPWEQIPFTDISLKPLFHGATPNLVLPLVIYLGIHEHSVARGSLLAFSLGWVLDILGAGPAFLFRFTMVAVWGASRLVSSRVSAQSTLTRLPLAFVMSIAESAIILIVLAIFSVDSRRPVELFDLVLPRAIATALGAFFIFPLAQRLHADMPSSENTQSQPTQS